MAEEGDDSGRINEPDTDRDLVQQVLAAYRVADPDQAAMFSSCWDRFLIATILQACCTAAILGKRMYCRRGRRVGVIAAGRIPSGRSPIDRASDGSLRSVIHRGQIRFFRMPSRLAIHFGASTHCRIRPADAAHAASPCLMLPRAM